MNSDKNSHFEKYHITVDDYEIKGGSQVINEKIVTDGNDIQDLTAHCQHHID